MGSCRLTLSLSDFKSTRSHHNDSDLPPLSSSPTTFRGMASSSSSPSPPPAEHHHLQDDDAVLSSLLLDLGRGYDDEQEVEDEHDISSTAVEHAPALGFDARAYHQLASEYYAQPLLLTGGEPTVAQWPQVQVGEEGTRTILAKALDACRVCRVRVPALVVGEEGDEEADGKKKLRLATLQEKDIEVRAVLIKGGDMREKVPKKPSTALSRSLSPCTHRSLISSLSLSFFDPPSLGGRA